MAPTGGNVSAGSPLATTKSREDYTASRFLFLLVIAQLLLALGLRRVYAVGGIRHLGCAAAALEEKPVMP